MTDDLGEDPPTGPKDEPLAPDDPRRQTQRSASEITQRRTAFADANSPESVVLAEISAKLGGLNAAITTIRTEVTDDIQGLRKEVANDIQGLRRQGDENTNRMMNAYETLRRHVIHDHAISTELWREVFEDRPPPPPPSKHAELSFGFVKSTGSAPEATAHQTGRHGKVRDEELGKMRSKVDSQTGEIDVLQGRLAAIDGTHQRELKRHDTELATVRREVQELLQLQREQMGLKRTGDERSVLRRVIDGIAWALVKREGQRYTATMIAGLTCLLWLTAYIYAIMTGHPPPPALHPPDFGEGHP